MVLSNFVSLHLKLFKFTEMKKLLLGLAAIAAFLNVSAQRTVDIEPTIISPGPGSTVFANIGFDVAFRVQNNGPDDIKVGDTIASFLIAGQQLIQEEIHRVTQVIGNGGSANFTRTNKTIISGGNSGQFNFCILVVLVNRGGVDTVRDNIAGGNNITCSQINYNAAGNSVGEISFNAINPALYPNPVQSIGNLTFNLPSPEKVSVKIFDLAGRMVANVFEGIGEGGENQVNFGTEGLANGLYIYRIETANQSVSNKFTIAR